MSTQSIDNAIAEVTGADMADRKPIWKANYKGVSFAIFPNVVSSLGPECLDVVEEFTREFDKRGVHPIQRSLGVLFDAVSFASRKMSELSLEQEHR